jgi:hypothetical protein
MLMECPALCGLPAGLRVKEYVSIRNCPGLNDWSDDKIKALTGAWHVVLQDDVPY